MFNRDKEQVNGTDVLEGLLTACRTLQPWADVTHIAQELGRYMNGGDAFGFGEHKIVVSTFDGDFLSRVAEGSLKRIETFPRKSFGDVATKVSDEARNLYKVVEGSPSLLHGMRAEREGFKELARLELSLGLVSVEAARTALMTKRKNLALASLLFGLFDLKRLIGLHNIRFQTNASE